MANGKGQRPANNVTGQIEPGVAPEYDNLFWSDDPAEAKRRAEEEGLMSAGGGLGDGTTLGTTGNSKDGKRGLM